MSKQNISNDEISLKELIAKGKESYLYLRSKWKVIVLAGVLGAGIGLVYAFIKKPVYTATLTFAMEDEKSSGGLGGALGLASSMGFDLGSGGGGAFASSNITELFKSRSMVEQTLLKPVNFKGKRISLAEMYIQNNDLRKEWEGDPKLKRLQFLPDADRKAFTRAQDSIFGVFYDELLKAGLSVMQKDKKVSILNLDVSSKNELFAKYFCESLARQVGTFYVTTKSQKARINFEILQKQLDSIRGQLGGAITSVAVATDRTFNLNPAMNVKRTPSTRKQVDVQVNTAILTELVKQTEMAKVTLRKETPLIQVIDRPILPLKKENFGKLKGIFLGAFLAGFLMVCFLIFKEAYRKFVVVKINY